MVVVSRILVMVGVAEDAVLGIYVVLEDPKSAVISLFIVLLDIKG